MPQSLSATRQAILNQSAQWLGVPYKWGKADPAVGFDCSGYTMAVYKTAAGISLPHLAAAQALRGKRVSATAAQPGDLVFFGRAGIASHEGILIADGMLRHAPHTGAVVRDESLATIGVPLICYRNLLGDSPAGEGSTTVAAAGGGTGGAPLPYADVYALARAAGLGSADAITATAIAAAESGLNPAAVGDVKLENGTWGPSVGLWQIRSVKSEQGKGSARDAAQLTDPVFNAHSMAKISAYGTSFSPWSTYTSGAYQHYIPQARAAATGAAPSKSTLSGLNHNYSVATDGGPDTVGSPNSSTSSGGGGASGGVQDASFLSDLNPFNWFGGLATDVEKTVMGGIVYGSVLGLGVGLVLIGLGVAALDATKNVPAPPVIPV